MSPRKRRRSWRHVRAELVQQLEQCSKTLSSRVQEARDETEHNRGPGDYLDKISDETVSLGVRKIDDAMCCQIRRAISHGDAGNYGTCEDCGERIADNRLAAKLFATRCIGCAEGQHQPADSDGRSERAYA